MLTSMHRSKWALQSTGHYTQLGSIRCFWKTLSHICLYIYLWCIHCYIIYLSIHLSSHLSTIFTYVLYTYTYRHISRTYDVPMCSHASSRRPVFLNFPWDYPSSRRVANQLPQAEDVSHPCPKHTHPIPFRPALKQNILGALLWSWLLCMPVARKHLFDRQIPRTLNFLRSVRAEKEIKG